MTILECYASEIARLLAVDYVVDPISTKRRLWQIIIELRTCMWRNEINRQMRDLADVAEQKAIAWLGEPPPMMIGIANDKEFYPAHYGTVSWVLKILRARLHMQIGVFANLLGFTKTHYRLVEGRYRPLTLKRALLACRHSGTSMGIWDCVDPSMVPDRKYKRKKKAAAHEDSHRE